MKKKISVIIPAYNEEKGITGVIRGLKEKLREADGESEIIVIDDGSTDNTAAVLKEIAGIPVITHSANKGYGAAIKTGIKAALYEYVAILDADGTYRAEELLKLIAALDNEDMVVGSRTAEISKIPLIRKPAKWAITRLANYLTGERIPDLNSGMRIMKKDTVNRFLRILPDGFSFTTTITLAMLTNDYQVKYVPIDYHGRKGKSKIRPIADTFNFLQLIVRTVLYFDPLKIFLPMSLFLFLAGVLLFLYRIFVAPVLVSTITIIFTAAFQMLAIGMLADLIDRRLSK